MREETVRVTCDVCGLKEHADHGSWDGGSPPYWLRVEVRLADKRGWVGDSRTFDVCEGCAQSFPLRR